MAVNVSREPGRQRQQGFRPFMRDLSAGRLALSHDLWPFRLDDRRAPQGDEIGSKRLASFRVVHVPNLSNRHKRHSPANAPRQTRNGGLGGVLDDAGLVVIPQGQVQIAELIVQEQIDERLGVGHAQARLARLFGREPVSHIQLPGLVQYGLHNLFWKQQSIPPVGVVTTIAVRTDELLQEVGVRAVDFDAVKPRFSRATRGRK